MPRARPRSYRGGARYILETVKVVLPNSRVENEEIERRFRVARPSVVVPNAADSSTFSPAPESSSGARRGVLCVGRIEPRKNQLALIRALAGTETRLRLVAPPIDSHQPYRRQCIEEAGDNVEFLPWRDQRDLCELFRESLVHACVSWYETPGLVNLEAALCECAIVSTVKGSVREYLLDDVHYCEPGDVASIREAVERALSSGPTPGLAERVRTEYSWEAAARKTLEGYEMALAMASEA
jgi:glycosyltransferase involved in cell wall biosynthesis